MLWAGVIGGLEVREAEGGATRLRATFPYGAPAELARGRSEVIAARAFAERIEAGGDIHLLSGHDFNRPLASRSAGTLELRETESALELEASISAELRAVSYVADFLTAHRAGLVRGISPGFRVPPGGERIERRGDGLLRTITRAELFEVSTVTRPAYPAAQIEARSWAAGQDAPDSGLARTLARWRA